tara:strand:- start:5070 stop:7664 length:2595 start_codon:yes stop_codon:yes gene_type:complete
MTFFFINDICDKQKMSESDYSPSGSESESGSDSDIVPTTPVKSTRPKRKRITPIKINDISEYSDFEDLENEINEHQAQRARFSLLDNEELPASGDSSWDLLTEEQRIKIQAEQAEIDNYTPTDLPLNYRVLLSDMPIKTKRIALERAEMLMTMREDTGDYHKHADWLRSLLKIGFGKYTPAKVSLNSSADEIGSFLSDSMTHMDKIAYGMKDAKTEIIQYLAQAISNPKANGNVLGLEGPPGTGKTTLIRNGLAKVLGKSCEGIALGGAGDATFLKGHGFTYEGSQCGRIVQGLQRAGTMDGIFFFDEVCKISKTPHGEEITGALMHLIDPSQNYQFHDDYYSGIDFDLSRVTFIFCFNDGDKIDPILRDRIKVIKIPGYSIEDKKNIMKDFLIPKLSKEVGFKENEIIWSDAIMDALALYSMEEEGVRTLEQDIKSILLKLNTLRLGGNNIEVPYAISNFKLPFTILPKHLHNLQRGPGRKNSLRELDQKHHAELNNQFNAVNAYNGSTDGSMNGMNTAVDTKHRILLSNLPIAIKNFALEKIKECEEEKDESTKSKLKTWIKHVSRLPLGKKIEIKIREKDIGKFLGKLTTSLDKAVYGMANVKDELIQLAAEQITNPNGNIGQAIGICGPPGTGKTALIRDGLAKALNRPIGFIALGGAKDSSFLQGHSSTYIGSIPGKIVEILQKVQVMNPIIVFDELDKLGTHEELSATIAQIIDPSQNRSFQDRYLSGIELDLSQVTFIFSFNDASRVDPALLNRIKLIEVNDYTSNDKLIIAQKYLIPRALHKCGLVKTDITITPEVIKYIINNVKEPGVRLLERQLQTVISKTSVARYLKPDKIGLKTKIQFPVEVDGKLANVFLK